MSSAVCANVAPIIGLTVGYWVYLPNVSVSAISNATECILATKI